MTTEPDAVPAPGAPTDAAAGAACPSCGEPVAGESNFCEACGAQLGSVSAAAPPGVAVPPATAAPARPDEATPIDLGDGPISAVTRSGLRLPGSSAADDADGAASPVRPCLQCGGVVDVDGYCQTCGSKALSERDHFREQPAPWVAGVCDKGVVHHRNEDAMALSATPDATAPDRRTVLVVLDGVSNTDDSSAGSLAGARAALPVLGAPLPQGMGTPAGRVAAVTRAFEAAVTAANTAVVGATTPGTSKPASATFAAVVLEGSTAWFANIGDSRCYWLPDVGDGVQLTVDDSAAQAQIAAGVPRVEAENSPQAHAITRWLGDDAPSLVPTVSQRELTEPGWLVACSDGLWNYASEPGQLAAQVTAAALGPDGDPAALALRLVEWANTQGGRDNITAVVARVDPVTAGHDAATPGTIPTPAAPPSSPGDADG